MRLLELLTSLFKTPTSKTCPKSNNIPDFLKVKVLPEKCYPDKIYIVKCTGGCKLYVTDLEGVPQPVISG